MKKVRYNGKDIFIDDTQIDRKNTGVIIRQGDYGDDALDKTIEIKNIVNLKKERGSNDE